MTYLLLMDRWKLSYEEVLRLPQHVADEMFAVMQAESRVEEEQAATRRRR